MSLQHEELVWLEMLKGPPLRVEVSHGASVEEEVVPLSDDSSLFYVMGQGFGHREGFWQMGCLLRVVYHQLDTFKD